MNCINPIEQAEYTFINLFVFLIVYLNCLYISINNCIVIQLF